MSLLAHECDLALVGAKASDRRVVSTPFADDEVVLVGPVPNPFAPSARLTPEQFLGVPLIVREEGSGTRQTIARALARPGTRDRVAGGLIEVGSTEAAKNCARHGVGLAFVSRRAVADEVKRGQLSLVNAPGLPGRRRFYAARLRHVTLPAAARTILSLLIRNYR
jgi:DNA-binding transcriptional LysR family regulator